MWRVRAAVGSIIMRIICDTCTFGELRTALDDAEAYRVPTNFVTGIPFSDTGSTPSQFAAQQYAWMLLYLRERNDGDLTPLELMVQEQVVDGCRTVAARCSNPRHSCSQTLV